MLVTTRRRTIRALAFMALIMALLGAAPLYAQDDPTPTPDPASGGVEEPALPPAEGVPTQPVQPNGVQLHVVLPGETLDAVAAAYGVDPNLVRSANGIADGEVEPGTVLRIPLPGEEDAPPPVEPGGEEPPPSNGPVPGEPDDSAPPPAPPPDAPGIICLTLFEDRNFNGGRDSDEPLIQGGLLSITGMASLSYSTDGISEPHCFANLTPGDYIAYGEVPANYQMLTPRETPLTLQPGEQVNLEYAASLLYDPAAQAAAEEAASSQRRLLLIVGMIGMGVMLMLLGAAALIAVRNRDRRKKVVVIDERDDDNGDDDADDPPGPEPDVILELKRE